MNGNNDDQHPEDFFSFSYWLKFNGLYFTEEIDELVDPDHLTEYVEEYSGGSPVNPDEGYRQTDLSDWLAQATELSGSLSNLADDLYTYEYVEEKWPEREVYNKDAVKETRYGASHKEMNIFWAYDDIMIIRAQKTVLNEVKGDLLDGLSDNLLLDQVNFDFDFLLWLLYQWRQNNRLRANLRLHAVSDCKTVGRTNRDREVEIGGETDITRSVPFISAILEGNKIDEIEGEFIIDGTHIVAKIESEGVIHVKSSREDMLELNELKQMGRSVQFLIEMMRLYEEWVKLDPEDRYPPKAFFETLLSICDDEGYVAKREPQELYDDYEAKRAGEVEGPMSNSRLNKFD
ncbi:hypothetical protein NDI85_16330 [Halomicroarcula sp. S1AR25-4]|uniref:hypothetical protein n=1 Tax=Haloarcula sp. S1AR25-4 TaxID=2950538 RepID=UPI00287713CE|nr:hypothetical protein [Halomicroarcula sp. S1AR25-4]MDS0279369.1 hypothetical protein [Halomicroarcula sp. S1AR25-4]